MKGKKNIVWIASYPKSGNTWFRVFLSNIINEKKDPADINSLTVSEMASGRSVFDQISGISSSALSREEIAIARPMVYRKLSHEAKDTLYMKVHDAWIKNQQGEPVFPEDVSSSVIYIIRHPLDVAVSLSYHNSENIETSLEKMNDPGYGLCLGKKKLFNQLPQELLSWSQHVNSWVNLSGLRVLVIRYEDMHLSPEQTFSNALNFLGIQYRQDELELAIKNSSIKVLQKQEQKNGFHEKPSRADLFFRKGIISDWKNHLDPTAALQFLTQNKKLFEQYY